MEKTLLELTLQNLEQSTIQNFPGTTKRQNVTHTVNISKIQFVVFPKTNQLKILASVTSGPNQYKCSMFFNDVYFEQSPSENLIPIKTVDEQQYYIYKIDSSINDVKVRCSCLDFYYRFSQTNYQNDALDGEPPKAYVKKTDRPSVNPNNAPGMCKHLLKLYQHLQTIKLLD